MSSVCSYNTKYSRQSSRTDIEKKGSSSINKGAYGENKKHELEEEKFKDIEKIKENEDKTK